MGNTIHTQRQGCHGGQGPQGRLAWILQNKERRHAADVAALPAKKWPWRS